MFGEMWMFKEYSLKDAITITINFAMSAKHEGCIYGQYTTNYQKLQETRIPIQEKRKTTVVNRSLPWFPAVYRIKLGVLSKV